ncbi:elongation factor G [Heyndrickxia shackletonii]|uniref:Elongation factor G n=1 Tax=Heyndrickxia shackletonii TaxID=157838 RepID=A0A0Q3TJ14_9BACI|nr:TetM/TetW/TetO/TetS family tetracycline resistance ribosomal protection protein [Heyndrickxia shackletonii]KQL53936.1 elongation factor G [Heyndrickxia shackletonii]NEY97780.1 TetM/TetW/TetO/TetS family tetracycline resistance ribosomal protection protein [Heyndrickxia shackletonii]
MKHKTIGILAHVDAGKTTFAEQLLFHTKSIPQRGRVDHRDAFLDSHEIEKARGITVFADQAIFRYHESHYTLIDTPGHVDFSPEMERAIQVMDYAIVIISAVEGVEGHTETVWNLLKKHCIPTFFFINKTDRVGADIHRVIEEIRINLTEDVCHIDNSFIDGKMDEPLIEFLAERNECLLDDYMAGGYEKKTWLTEMQQMIKNNAIFPLASGSALQDVGITDFLEKLDILTITDYVAETPFSGRVYKIRYDESGARTTFIKALSGTLKVRDEITYDHNEQEISEKVTQIRKYNGRKFQIVDKVEAGEVFALTGLSAVAAGDGLGSIQEKAHYEMIPTLKSKVIFDPTLNVKEVLKCFRMLDDEDPSLMVAWEEKFQEIHIHVMGTIQLEVLEQIVHDRFGFKVLFEKPEILYKETITSEVVGYGHFEPLKHYAEVHLRLEPGERQSGVRFVSDCHPDDLQVSYQNLIRHHLFEKEHRGILTGSALTDIKITLLTGRAHIKHTSGGDFREATLRALRQGLEKAENQLLEPYYDFKIKVDIEQMGRVLSDVQSAYGNFQNPETAGNKAIISGKVPVATFMDYGTILASFTQGRGTMSLVFGGYYPCHNQNEVMEKIQYDKNADPEYTSSSIFCSKGAGYSVPWDEAESKMHLLK